MSNKDGNDNADLIFQSKDRVFERTQGCWNCVAMGSLILTPNGPIAIEDAVKTKKVFSRYGWSRASMWIESGVKPVLEVKTSHGGRVLVTQDHKIFTDKGWVAACDLVASGPNGPGHEIQPMPAKALDNTQNEIDIQEALLLGALTGDGWIKAPSSSDRGGVGFGFKADRLDAWRPLLDYAKERFGSDEQPHFKTKDRKFLQLEWRSQGSRSWAFMLDKGHVPLTLWSSTPEVIGSYLKGLFSTDGTISRTERPAVTFFQTTERLIDEVHLLLRLVGITSHRRVELRAQPHNDLFSLTIARQESLQRFAELAGFVDRRRNDFLQEFAFRKLVKDQPPERITAVTLAGCLPVYDISVPATESFFTGHMLVHNCTHGSREAAKTFWTQKRQQDLGRAMNIALNSPHGEQDVKVENIKRMVDTIDHGVASGAIVKCTGHGKTAKGEPVGDLVANSFLCGNWTAAQGASIARGGQKPDELPEEIMDRIDNVGGMTGVPESVRSLLGNKKVN